MVFDVVIVGGGVIGMLSALELAAAGRRVALLEAGVVAREASWAGGGIVSPLYPWRYSEAVWALARHSQEAYPALAESLLERTGIDPEHHVTGLYWLDLDDEEQALAWAREHDRPLQSVPMTQVRTAIPALGPDYARALFMPGVANIRNPRLGQALRAALQAEANVSLFEHSRVLGLETEGERVRGVRTAAGTLLAEQVVLCAGAWTAQLLAPLGLELPVEPVKGQMILYRCDPTLLPHMVLSSRRYAIPRRDGHILVGSTLEHVGFDKTPSAEALQSLQRTAAQLLPALADAPVVGHWAGLRPGSPEGIPYIGAVPQVEGLWLNCGHHRNGLVMAPASCRLLADLMLGRAVGLNPQPYAPARLSQQLG